ncbi:hypothetical protein IGI04_006652 [Brassica rapa subsp. trilocularis]|uniref:Uncharacterized protein n=1 Tax=Brassica rapa subsp. trilocularis TaxID=1813537 RepID=A0ABQ7NHI2_BRACM|nr:hypothetical protein IGI04_006652 [Brassica rapa subsp. trilocularis]
MVPDTLSQRCINSPSSLEPRIEGAKLVMILCISMELGCLNHHRESHKTHFSLHNDPCYTSCSLWTGYVQWYYAMAISHCIINHTTLPVDYGLTCPSDDMQWHKTFVTTFLAVGETTSHLSIVTTSSLPSLEQAVDFPQNVGNRLHSIILFELQDQEHITLTAALKSLIHPFAFSFKYPQITSLPHGLDGDLLLLVCLEPGAQQPCGLRFLNRLLHTRTFPLLHTMVGLSLVCLEPGAQQPRGLRFLNQLLHTSIFPLLHTMVQVVLLSWIGGE